MPSGLAALLDDVAAIAKMAAASVDDVSAAAGRAGVKAAGVVVDDAAVTPGYAMGFSPQRELPIIGKIAIGSLKNKFLILLPGALLISAFAPWALTPLLMMGGAYLCFEASEKIWEKLAGHDHGEIAPDELALSSEEQEKKMVGSAIRTDLILSAEITAIALADLAERPLATQAAALAVVGLLSVIFTINEFVIASALLQSPQKLTLAVGLQQFIGEKYSENWGPFAAGALLAAIPVVLLFIFLQKFIVGGLTQGSVKG